MWSDNDIDNAFQRLNPPEPEPTPFPLDAWLRLESQLDKAVIERAVRRRLWQFFAAEVAVVLLIALGWLLWPAGKSAPKEKLQATTTGANAARSASGSGATQRHTSAGRAATASASVRNQLAQPVAARPAAVATDAGVTQKQASAGLSAPARPRFSPYNPVTRHRPGLLASVLPEHRQTGRSGQLAAEAQAYGQEPAGRPVRVSQPEADGVTAITNGATAARATAMPTAFAESTPAATTDGQNAGHPSLTAARTVGASPQRGAGGQRQTLTPAEPAAARLPATATEAALPAAPAVASQLLRSVALATPEALILPAPLPTGPEPKSTLPAPVRLARVFVGLVGAPDVSTVKFASVGSPLPNVGVTLEYRLTNRLRVNTGLLRSTKKYTARREDYDFGVFTGRVYQHDFEDVEGACTVLDVPLNLRYDLLARPQYRVFGSAGLSSFFMQHENYTYEYEENNMSKYWQGSAQNQNKHLLSILNLSAGYERSLGTHWSVQAEPYLKLPLAGVGLGKVRLTSAGVFFGVKYGL